MAITANQPTYKIPDWATGVRLGCALVAAVGMLLLAVGAHHADGVSRGTVNIMRDATQPKQPTPLGTPPSPSPVPMEPEMGNP